MVFSQAEQAGAGEVTVVGLHCLLGRVEVEHAGVVGRYRLGLDAPQHGCTAPLVHVGVGVVADDVLVAPLAVRHESAQVRLGAARHVQSCWLVQQFGGVTLQFVDGGVVAPHVVPDLGCGHGGPHVSGRARNSVGTQVDHGSKPAMGLVPCNVRRAGLFGRGCSG